MKNALCLLAALVLLTACDSGSKLATGEKDEVTMVTADDAEMNAAIAKANASLDEFLKAREAQGEDFKGILKARFTEPGDDNAEHMWVMVSAVNGDRISGELLSTPDWLKNVKYGEIVTVPRADVSDWVYVRPDGLAEGGYTMKLIRSRMSTAERAEYDATSAFTFAEEEVK